MISHEFKPDPHGRDVCDQKFDEDGRVEFCGQRRSEHMDETHALKIQLAAALKDVAYFKASYARKLEDEKQLLESASATVEERDALRTALTEVNDLLLSVPAGEDWRARVRKKVVVALFGEAAWKET